MHVVAPTINATLQCHFIFETFARYAEMKTILKYQIGSKEDIDRVGPVDNRPSTD